MLNELISSKVLHIIAWICFTINLNTHIQKHLLQTQV